MNKQIFNRLAVLLFLVAVVIGTVIAVIIVNQSQSQDDFNHLETVDYGSDDNSDDLPHMDAQVIFKCAIEGNYKVEWPMRLNTGDTINLNYDIESRIMTIQHYHHLDEQDSLYVWEE